MKIQLAALVTLVALGACGQKATSITTSVREPQITPACPFPVSANLSSRPDYLLSLPRNLTGDVIAILSPKETKAHNNRLSYVFNRHTTLEGRDVSTLIKEITDDASVKYERVIYVPTKQVFHMYTFEAGENLFGAIFNDQNDTEGIATVSDSGIECH